MAALTIIALAILGYAAVIERRLARLDRGGSLAISTDDDTPLMVNRDG